MSPTKVDVKQKIYTCSSPLVGQPWAVFFSLPKIPAALSSCCTHPVTCSENAFLPSPISILQSPIPASWGHTPIPSWHSNPCLWMCFWGMQPKTSLLKVWKQKLSKRWSIWSRNKLLGDRAQIQTHPAILLPPSCHARLYCVPLQFCVTDWGRAPPTSGSSCCIN
jgi:hypothetical protein